MKPAARHIDFLDDIRGIAIAAVFCFHSLGAAFGSSQLPWSGPFRSFDVPLDFLLVSPAMFGSLGVALFFVVSGFCIHLSFRRTPDWREFLRRRFFRIYPPYALAVLLFALIYPVSRLAYSSRSDYANLFSHLLLIHNLNENLFFGINSSFWSIAVEVQLYLLYPLVLMLVSRTGWLRTMWLLVAIEVVLRGSCLTLDTMGATCPTLLSGSPFSYWASWTVGAYLAEAYLTEADQPGRPLPFARWSLPVLAIAAFGSVFWQPTSYFAFALFSLLTAAVIARLLSARGGPRTPGRVSTHLRTAGAWSFSLYLLHQPLLKSLMLLVPSANGTILEWPLVRFAICLASWFVILPLAGLAYRWCELPSISLGHAVLRRGRIKSPAIEQA